jgi:hypothetical protein
LQADLGLFGAGFEHDRQPPGGDIGRHRDLADRRAPVAIKRDLPQGAAIAALPVEADQSAGQGLAGENLQLGIERGAHRQAALLQLVLAIKGDQLAAHFLGEGFGGEELGAEGARIDLQVLAALPSSRPR